MSGLEPDLLDGPLVAAAHRHDADHATSSRLAAALCAPINPNLPVAPPREPEEVHIKLLQGLIDRYEQQNKAPCAVSMYTLQLPGVGVAQQQQPQQFPVLLPAETKGLLWDEVA